MKRKSMESVWRQKWQKAPSESVKLTQDREKKLQNCFEKGGFMRDLRNFAAVLAEHQHKDSHTDGPGRNLCF